jgi:hypothetical protein
MYVQCNAKNNLQIIFVTHKVDNRYVRTRSTIIIEITVHLFHEHLLLFFAVCGEKKNSGTPLIRPHEKIVEPL